MWFLRQKHGSPFVFRLEKTEGLRARLSGLPFCLSGPGQPQDTGRVMSSLWAFMFHHVEN